MTPSRLLVCVDGSPPALRAARLAIALAAGWGARVRVICVVDTADAALMEPVVGDGVNLEERLVEAARASTAQIVELGAGQDVPVEAMVATGTPFEKILEEARRFQPDLIFMGRTGRRGPGRVLVGSETERVLEFTGWPVVVVPAEATPAAA